MGSVSDLYQITATACMTGCYQKLNKTLHVQCDSHTEIGFAITFYEVFLSTCLWSNHPCRKTDFGEDFDFF